jgi:hypothetical protein
VTIAAWGLGLFLTIVGLPGLVLVWLAPVVRALASTPPLLTGQKGPDGRPTPAHEQEVKDLTRYLRLQAVKSASFNPVSVLIPVGVPLIGALAVAGAVFCVPQGWWWMRVVQSVVAALAVLAGAGGRRVNPPGMAPNPASSVADLATSIVDKPIRLLGALVGLLGALACLAVVVVAKMSAPALRERVWEYFAASGTSVPDVLFHPVGGPGWGFLVSGFLAAALLGLWRCGWRERTFTRWRLVEEARTRWANAWEVAGLKPAPTPSGAEPILIGKQQIGSVLSWTVPPGSRRNAPLILDMANQIKAGLDTAQTIAFAPSPATDPASGAPLPDVVSATVFRVIVWDEFPDITDESLPQSVAELTLQTGAALACEGSMAANPLLLDARVATQPGTPRVWRASFTDPWNDGWGELRATVAPKMGAQLGCEALADSSPRVKRQPAPPCMWVGALAQDDSVWASDVMVVPDGHDPATPAQYVKDLRQEDKWVRIWLAAQVTNWPILNHSLSKSGDLAVGWRTARDGTETPITIPVSADAFILRVGNNPVKEVWPAEARMPTAIQPPPGAVVFSWWPDEKDPKPGGRNDTRMRVITSVQPFPPPQKLPPQPDLTGGYGFVGQRAPETAANWYWVWQVARMFDAVKLPRPEPMAVKCLTTKDSMEHVWQVALRLYGGVTVKDLRAKLPGLQAAATVPWMLVAEMPGGDAALLLGGVPTPLDGEEGSVIDGLWRVTAMGAGGGFGRRSLGGRSLARVCMPEKQWVTVDDVQWRGWWGDAKVQSPTGARPQLVSSEPLPQNSLVTRRVFQLPSGVSLPIMRDPKAKGSVMAASGNGWLDIQPNPDDPGQVVLLCARTDPMPRYVPYSFDNAPTPRMVPCGVLVDGTVLALDLRVTAHVLLAGTSGSGKSWAGAAMMMSLLRAGCQVVVADPEKKAGSFKWAKPWLSGFAVTLEDTVAALEFAIAEMNARRDQYTDAGCEDIDGLDESVRPPDLVVFVDEFSNLIKQGARPKQTSEKNPEDERRRLEDLAQWTMRGRVASLADSIAAAGRSSGVHVFPLSQALKADSLPDSARNLRNNLNRVLLGKASPAERASGLTDPNLAPDPGEEVPRGRGVWDPRIGRPALVQFWGSEPVEYAAYLEEHLPKVEPFDWSGFMPSMRDISGYEITSAAGPEVVEEVSWEDWDFAADMTPAEGDVADGVLPSSDVPDDADASIPAEQETAPEPESQWWGDVAPFLPEPDPPGPIDEPPETFQRKPRETMGGLFR